MDAEPCVKDGSKRCHGNCTYDTTGTCYDDSSFRCGKIKCGISHCLDCFPEHPLQRSYPLACATDGGFPCASCAERGECAEAGLNRNAETNWPDAPKTILEEADALTGNGGDRNDAYDHPYPNFSKIAKVWSAILNVPVTPRQVALCMIGMKCVRDSHKARRDNIVDIAGYARCIERLDEFTDLNF